MIEVLAVLRWSVVIAFAALAIAATIRLPRSGPAGTWVALAFGSLALALMTGRASVEFDIGLPTWVAALQVVVILVVPYLLLRFTASFRDLPSWVEVPAGVLLAGAVAGAVLLPDRVTTGWFIATMLAYWIPVSGVTVGRLWWAGSDQPTVARRRMRLMSAATGMLAVALLVTGVGIILAPGAGSEPVGALWSKLLVASRSADAPGTAFAVQLTALASGLLFGAGFAPPRALRLVWRRTEEQHLRRATEGVMKATTVEGVSRAILAPTVEILGAGGAALLGPNGEVIASHVDGSRVRSDPGPAEPAGQLPRQVIPLGDGLGELVVWTSPYAPFFSRDELDLLHMMASVTSLALERCRWLEQERAQREAIERAGEEARAARREAERANLAKSEFLSRMSHELRTPLNAILGFGQLLETGELDEDDTESVTQILKAGRHLLELINEVLDLSRIEAGTLAISLEPVQVAELIGDAVALVGPGAEERSIELSVDRGGCDVYVMTDRQRCRQVLLNLLSNAVKYNHDGGRVDVRCGASDDGMLRIWVRDSGPGIDPDRQVLLFQPFERLGAETSSVEGTGLGLALSRQLVERLGGRIGVDSSRPDGSAFWVDLPLTDGPSEQPEQVARHQVPVDVGERTVLLVEDNLANVRVVEAMLRRRPGISVLPTMQGRLAVELATQHQPDVIVLDLHLPDLPGRDVLNRLQADERTRGIPVVVASADARPSQIRQVLDDGAFEYLTKPLDLLRFLEVIDAALAHRDAGVGPGGP